MSSDPIDRVPKSPLDVSVEQLQIFARDAGRHALKEAADQGLTVAGIEAGTFTTKPAVRILREYDRRQVLDSPDNLAKRKRTRPAKPGSDARSSSIDRADGAGETGKPAANRRKPKQTDVA